MKGHWKHMAMCSPMLIVVIVLIASGVNVVAAFLPLVGCMLMMWLMMRSMPHGHGHGDR